MENITITRSVQVSLDELTKEDIKDMSQRDEVEDVALKLLQWCNELSAELNVLKTAPVQVAVVLAEDPPTQHKKRKHYQGDGSTFGHKIGKTSKYHLVSFDKKGGYRASTSINGKTVHMGRDKDEIQCALLTDKYLDSIGDEKRNRNRDDFPEVMTAYRLEVKR